MDKGCKVTIVNGWGYSAKIECIFLSKNVKTINSDAFRIDTRLNTIEFEEGTELIFIGSYAFYRTNITNFKFPSGCTKVSSYLFSQVSSLKKIYIPPSLVNIDTDAFSGAPNIELIEIDPENPEYDVIYPATLILKNGTSFIYISPSTTAFTIPYYVVSFGKTIFQSCTQLTSINADTSSPYFDCDGGIVYSKGFRTAIACIGGITSVTLNPLCTSIGEYCFNNCTKLTNVELNEGLLSIGSYAFFSINFTSIRIPSSVISLGTYCFYSSNLQYIEFNGDGPKTISQSCFQESQIKEIHFGKNLQSLDYLAFYQCKQIECITFHPECSIDFSQNRIFGDCNKLNNFQLPKSVEKITSFCFSGTFSLTNFLIEEGSMLNYIDELAFENSAIESISFPSSLNFIGVNAFKGCWKLKIVNFSKDINLKVLGGGIFRSCIVLPSIEIPASVTTFDPSSIGYCSSLTSINVSSENKNYSSNDGIVYTINKEKLVCCPGGKTSAFIYKNIYVIGSNAFWGCSKLKDLTFEDGCNLRIIEEGTFYSCTSLFRIDLPMSLETVQKSAFEGCTKLAIITFPDFAMADLDYESIFADCTSLTTFSFGRFCALNALGESIFSNCVKLSTINIPANCTAIRANAFKNCVSLTNISFESNSRMSTISETAFAGCTSLTNYTVPDSFVNITSSCFGGATSITTVNIGPNLSIISISSNAFASFRLKYFNIGSGTTISRIDSYAFADKQIETFSLECDVYLSSYAFKNCVNLKSVGIRHIKGDLESTSKKLMSTASSSRECYTIPEGLFSGCKSLESISINMNIETISDYAFMNCFKLSFTIPQSVVYIGDKSFMNCSMIKNVPAMAEHIGNFSFYGSNVCRVLKVNSGVTYIGSSAFTKTAVNLIFYCGERDFSNFSSSFESGAKAIVSESYPSNIFCGAETYYIPFNLCNDMIRIQTDQDKLPKPIGKFHNSFTILLLCSTQHLGIW
ncbi:surface antigen BspA-like [Trichomonas vaginalis G3]|uniref:Surface antigen BspA-like n=1 Tax=Trichomonas vaginalis (strain ATCC PRA-98 / G3) TaxID=412133 RepID=A2FHB4_TRIV3|nr:leucine-rich repeats (6 copies)-containing protein [Trichomonas vaginalis G3]EAX95711.1 surface antigen BspA-like [Trichomonas vaginalis G3]KAI5491204.1 leucine-rich repeats (6 copies)-containing protein [Trichomonas vaginalis G3]|eukprot:XP_001308641.1 surface antigen BspA-like [Trichomonas vaginalis G3]